MKKDNITETSQDYYNKIITTLNNPLNLTKELVEQMPEPREYPNSKFVERVIVPRSLVNYDRSKQPRDKLNDKKHLQDLKNDYEVYGIRTEKYPPIVKKSTDSTNEHLLEGVGGWHRNETLSQIDQEFYVYDIYRFDSPWAERVVRNGSNWSTGPAKTQSRNDYIKEICNAVEAGEISSDEESIDKAIEEIAADTTAKTRRFIKKEVIANTQVIANFRTYNPEGGLKSNNSVKYFCHEQGIPFAGTEGRTDQEVIEQGCITYFASNTNNFSTWGRGWFNAAKYGVPIIIFAYLEERAGDIIKAREEKLNEFIKLKQMWVSEVFKVASVDNTGEDHYFPIKLGGFAPQNIMPDNVNRGLPTETTLVDVEGNAIEFNPEMRCLSESSNI
jgi:hypothetical protein